MPFLAATVCLAAAYGVLSLIFGHNDMWTIWGTVPLGITTCALLWDKLGPLPE